MFDGFHAVFCSELTSSYLLCWVAALLNADVSKERAAFLLKGPGNPSICPWSFEMKAAGAFETSSQ